MVCSSQQLERTPYESAYIGHSLSLLPPSVAIHYTMVGVWFPLWGVD